MEVAPVSRESGCACGDRDPEVPAARSARKTYWPRKHVRGDVGLTDPAIAGGKKPRRG
jgi:hypothetical protein